jgi:hypothetical protein
LELPDEQLLDPNSQSSSSAQSFDCSDEALKYVAGYIAHKFRFKFPELGEKTSSMNVAKKLDYPWIAALSRGGLCAPSPEFTFQAFQIEKYFNLIHGQTFKDGSSIIKSTTDQVVRMVSSLPGANVKKLFYA